MIFYVAIFRGKTQVLKIISIIHILDLILQKSIDEQYAAFKEKSEGISKEKCDQWLKKAQQKLIGKVTGGDYQKSMGYKQYLEDLAALEKKYNQTPLGTMVC